MYPYRRNIRILILLYNIIFIYSYVGAARVLKGVHQPTRRSVSLFQVSDSFYLSLSLTLAQTASAPDNIIFSRSRRKIIFAWTAIAVCRPVGRAFNQSQSSLCAGCRIGGGVWIRVRKFLRAIANEGNEKTSRTVQRTF